MAISASTSAASFSSSSVAPGSSGFGNGHGGKVRVGRELALDDVHVGQSGPHERVDCVLAADAVQWR